VTSLTRSPPYLDQLLYEEVRGLVFNVNVISFSLYSMHSHKVPKRCWDESDGRSSCLNAIEEALDFLHTGFTQGSCPRLERVSFAGISYKDLKGHWEEFLALAGCVKHMQITVPLTDWSLYLLHHWDLERIKDLEEGGEPYTPEREQMQKRKDSYMRTGEGVQELVAGIDVIEDIYLY
jgi:hypothetical protein